MAKTFTATARREGTWWIITVPELDAVTQARHVRDINEMATGPSWLSSISRRAKPRLR
jgi:hypothetical protein